ncbi:hypothetical protein ACS0TY_004425 [Phlomoides rotata]
MQLGSGYAFEAELATALHAICIAAEKGWTQVWIECDSMYVVHCLRNTDTKIPWRLLPLWHRTRSKLANVWLVVSHIYREGNVIADRLTRESVDGLELDGGILLRIFSGPT